MKDKIAVGTVVISSAGHDGGRLFAVTGAEEGYVYLSDGKERKLAAPKRKNTRHVRLTSHTLDMEGMTDRKLRRALRAIGGDTPEESEQLV